MGGRVCFPAGVDMQPTKQPDRPIDQGFFLGGGVFLRRLEAWGAGYMPLVSDV